MSLIIDEKAGRAEYEQLIKTLELKIKAMEEKMETMSEVNCDDCEQSRYSINHGGP
jgi:hypothetical protein